MVDVLRLGSSKQDDGGTASRVGECSAQLQCLYQGRSMDVSCEHNLTSQFQTRPL